VLNSLNCIGRRLSKSYYGSYNTIIKYFNTIIDENFIINGGKTLCIVTITYYNHYGGGYIKFIL